MRPSGSADTVAKIKVRRGRSAAILDLVGVEIERKELTSVIGATVNAAVTAHG